MNKSSINNEKRKNFLVKEKIEREREIIKVITITNKKKFIIHAYTIGKKDPTTTKNLKRIKK